MSFVLLVSPSSSFSFLSVELDPAWPAAGVTLASPMAPAGTIRSLPDGAGGLLLVWHEARDMSPASCNCRNTDDLYAQRLDAAGRKAWSRTDVAVCRWGGMWGGADSLAAFSPTDDGGAIVAWTHGDGPSGTFAQRLGPDGALRWGADGVTLFVAEMSSRWTGRSVVNPGGDLWFGLDDNSERNVRVGRCIPGPGGLPCSTPFTVPLPGTARQFVLLPGDRPGRALIAASSQVSANRSRIDLIPLGTDAVGRARPGSLLPVATMALPEAWFAAEPDGAGGAVIGWAAPSGTGFDAVVRAVGPRGGTRWTRILGPTIRANVPPFITPGARGVTVAWQPGPGRPLAVETLDARGRTIARRVAGRSFRSERRAVVADLAGGRLLAWIESDGGDRESLRIAPLDAAGASATVPLEGFTLLRSEARITAERIAVPAPDRAVILYHDGGAKALRAIGLAVR